MPLTDLSNKKQYTADGIQTTYPFPYPFFAAGDLQVYVGSTLKTLATDYTLVGVNGADFSKGANVVFGVAPGAAAAVTIARVLEIKQPTNYKDYANFPNEQFNNDLDRRSMVEQQLQEQINRQFAVDVTEDAALDLTLPPSATWANQFLGFDAEKKLMVGSPAGAPTSPFAATFLDDPDAPSALTTLGVSAFVKTLLDDANAPAALGTLGVSAFIKTLLDDADANEALSTLQAGLAVVLAGNGALKIHRSHLVTAIADLSLPAAPSQGDEMEILADQPCRIVQSDAEHVIRYRKSFYTTKGVSGYFRLGQGECAKLTYFGADFAARAPAKIADPATLPASTGRGAAWAPAGRYSAIAHSTTPFVTIYDWQTGSPVKIANPASLPTGTAANGLAWSPNGRYLAVVHDSSPFVTIYDWNSGSPVKIADPATLPAGIGWGAAWSPDSRYLAVGHATTPFVTIYDWQTGSPVKIVAGFALPAGQANNPGWSPDGRYLAVPHDITPFLTIYDWQTGNPVKILAGFALPAGTANTASWSPDGRYLTVAHVTTPFLTTYDWQTGNPVKTPNPATLPPADTYAASWSLDQHYLVLTYGSTIIIYDWNQGNPFPIAAPATPPPATTLGLGWSPSGRYLIVAHGTTPFITIYDWLLAASKVWVADINGIAADIRFKFR